jgi:V/A-type H+-transporting ATPase subunit D
MAVRPPPGRSGRLWLARRLAVASRAAELLDQKLRALLAEEQRLAAESESAGAEWARTVGAAERWAVRAELLAGQRQLDLVRADGRQPATVAVSWRSWMGVTYPGRAELQPGRPGASALGGTAALDMAAAAYADALAAAVRLAAATRALDVVRGEVRATRARQRALERRWVPQLSDALARLEVALDELEREDAVRWRWLQAPRG